MGGDPHRQTHTVPVEDRISLARTIVMRSQEGEATIFKFPETLNWPADVVDAVLFLLCGIGRRVSVRSLGSSAEEVADHLLEALVGNYPDMAARCDTIRKIIELAEDHEGLLEWAMEYGYNPDPSAANVAASPRFDSRSRSASSAFPFRPLASSGQRPPPGDRSRHPAEQRRPRSPQCFPRCSN